MMQNGDSLTPQVDMAKKSAYKWWVLAVICVGTFTSTMDNSIVNIAIPTLGDTFNVGETISVWVYLAYMLTVAGLTLTFGQTGDKIGRKKLYIIGLLLTVLGLALNSIAVSMPILIAFRVVQAIGAGMMIAVGPAMITNVFPDRDRGKAMGIYTASVSAGLTIGPVLGGVLLDSLGWQSIFYTRLPIVIIVAVLSWKLLKEQRSTETQHSFDKWGSIVFFLAMFTLLLGLNQSGKQGWTSPLVLTSIIAAALLIPAFIAIERKVAQPLLELKLFLSMPFALSNLSLMLSFLARIFAVFLMPFFLIQGLGYSPSRAGLAQITIPIAMMIVSPITGRLSDRIGSRILTTAGFAVIGVSLLLFSRLDAASSFTVILLMLSVLGVGIGLFESPNNSLIMGSVPEHKRGTASAMLATSRGIGLTLGLAIASSIYALRKTTSIAQGTAEEAAVIGSFQYAILIVAFLSIAGVILSLLAGNAKRKHAA
ncbi:MFS transporter [Chloroflexota bacterium]